MIYSELITLKKSHRPDYKIFDGMPNERISVITRDETRRRTRPWDYCWFSNKPHIITLTVEEALNKYPSYILWCYDNLNIKWSTHTIKLFNKKRPPRRMVSKDFNNLKHLFI